MSRSDWFEQEDFLGSIEHEVYFEECEERLVLSADPLPAFAPLAAPAAELVQVESPLARLMGNAARQPVNTGAAWSDAQFIRSSYGLTGAGQTVAVIDSGIAYDHVALGGGYGGGKRVVGGWDFAENDANPYDDGPAGFHGTHIAGIVGANDATTPGVATGVDLVALRVFDDSGRSSFAWVEQALQWVQTNRNSFANPITTVNLSIGYSWNADTIPEWANLEDEFVNLENAGIFISVSAGNDFTSYNTAGLSYPAASPNVVPVASVTSAGQLSTFSQRNSRVLAAPGQGVVSTVPDHMYGADGIKNDFAAASGTSMAAPWVAGASTLVRQAMQRKGQTGINQDTIYNVLRSTADSIYDATTSASYARVNLRRAVEAVLSGEVSNTPADNAWGELDYRESSRQTVAGERWIDVTAANRGFLTFESWFDNAQGNIDLELYRSDGSLAVSSRTANSGERVDLRVNAGESFRIHIVGSNANVGWRFVNQVDEVSGTVIVRGSAGNDQFEFRVGNNTSLVLANGTGYDFVNASRPDYRVLGNGGNDSLVIRGTASDETATYGDRGVNFKSGAINLRSEATESVLLYGQGGHDSASFRGTAGADTLTATPGDVNLTGAGFSARAVNFERVEVQGAGGTDTASFYDSAGNDIFTGTPTVSYMTSGGIVNVASGFSNVYATSQNGGTDIAGFYDSAGDDIFHISGRARRLQGDQYFIRTQNFAINIANASAGNDVIALYDIDRQDTLYGRGQQFNLISSDQTAAYGFERAVASAKAGHRPRVDILAVDYLFSKNF